MEINMNTIPTTFKSIDIHTHILFGMDHGALNLNESKILLSQAKEAGVKELICTPHYHYDNALYNKNFGILMRYANKLGVKIYKGNEVRLSEELVDELDKRQINTLNDSKYILIELRRNNKYNFSNLLEILSEIINLGYKIIIAHPEIISNAFENKKELLKLRDMGILFQVDASSYYQTSKYKRKINKLIKLKLIDFVASDIHIFTRDYDAYQKFYYTLVKKCGKEYADKLYYKNPLKVIKNRDIK